MKRYDVELSGNNARARVIDRCSYTACGQARIITVWLPTEMAQRIADVLNLHCCKD